MLLLLTFHIHRFAEKNTATVFANLEKFAAFITNKNNLWFDSQVTLDMLNLL